MKNKLFFLLLISTSCFSQVGIGTEAVDNDAILELKSAADNQGLLMSETYLVSLLSPAPFPSHTTGMVVYNKATSSSDPENIYPGLYYNDGSSWKRMATDGLSPTVGDMKQSVRATDHDGWYALDGRALALLPAQAQTNAATIGFAANLPYALDCTLKGRSATEDFGDTGGAASFTLAQANLPNVTYTGTTSSAGAHTHTYYNRGNTYWNYNAGGVGGLRYTNGATLTTGSSGAHTHTITVPVGGSNTPVAFRPKYMVFQSFIYLGN